MKPLAARTEHLEQSFIRAVSRMVHTVDGINLGQGICDMPTPAPVKQGAQRAIEEDHSVYSNYAGIRRLRAALVDKSRRYNRIPVASDEEIMISAGSTGAFATAILALFEPGDEIILFEPYYGYHVQLLRAIGAVPVFVPIRDQKIDFDEVDRAVTSKTRAILVNTPGNPGGKVWTRDELSEILTIVQRHDLVAITDEIYEYILYDGREHVSLASLPDAYERTITLSGFSKTYNMTGWRLGYAVAPEPYIGKMGLLNDLLYICAPTPLQYGVAEAFSMSDDYFSEMNTAYARKREMLCRSLESIGFDTPWPEGAYYVLAGFDALSTRRSGFEDDWTACETLIREAGIGTVPGRAFFSDPNQGGKVLRFCFAKELPVLEDACRRLEKAFG